MYSLDQESLERVHLKDSRGYAGDDLASSWLPNINKCHPPRFSRAQPAPVDPILQTTTAKRPHTNLFLPAPFVCLFVYFSPTLWGTEPWELSEACAHTILDVKETMRFNQKKKKKKEENPKLSSRSLSPSVQKSLHMIG